MLARQDVQALCSDEVSFGFFRNFCRESHIEEALLYVRGVALYRESPKKERAGAARFLVKMFIAEDSRLQINVGAAIAAAVLAVVNREGGEIPVSVFDEAEAEVLAQLQQAYAQYWASEQRAHMEAERGQLHGRMFGAEELAFFREGPPVQLLIPAGAARVLATLRNPGWWERADERAVVAVSRVGPGAAAGTLAYERDVTTHLGPLTFRNILATTQWSEGEVRTEGAVGLEKEALVSLRLFPKGCCGHALPRPRRGRAEPRGPFLLHSGGARVVHCGGARVSARRLDWRRPGSAPRRPADSQGPPRPPPAPRVQGSRRRRLKGSSRRLRPLFSFRAAHESVKVKGGRRRALLNHRRRGAAAAGHPDCDWRVLHRHAVHCHRHRVPAP